MREGGPKKGMHRVNEWRVSENKSLVRRRAREKECLYHSESTIQFGLTIVAVAALIVTFPDNSELLAQFSVRLDCMVTSSVYSVYVCIRCS